MLKEVAQVLLAIQFSTSNIPAVRAEKLAEVIQQQSSKIGIDPIIEVAIVEHESQFNETVISKDGLDFGLMQIRAKHYGGSREYLLNGDSNIMVGSYLIGKSIDYCRDKVLHRQPQTQEWLSMYQGSGFRCKPTKLTKQFEDYYLCLKNIIDTKVISSERFPCRSIYKPLA